VFLLSLVIANTTLVILKKYGVEFPERTRGETLHIAFFPIVITTFLTFFYALLEEILFRVPLALSEHCKNKKSLCFIVGTALCVFIGLLEIDGFLTDGEHITWEGMRLIIPGVTLNLLVCLFLSGLKYPLRIKLTVAVSTFIFGYLHGGLNNIFVQGLAGFGFAYIFLRTGGLVGNWKNGLRISALTHFLYNIVIFYSGAIREIRM
jgi:membrane protease YdiL (CAAX protease family)